MPKLKSKLNGYIQVQVGSASYEKVDTQTITRLIASLTNDPRAIERATDLIMRQLAFHSVIKQFDFKCLIFKTLKQLGYQEMASRYHYRFLAKEVTK